jgi:hypothetical protein
VFATAGDVQFYNSTVALNAVSAGAAGAAGTPSAGGTAGAPGTGVEDGVAGFDGVPGAFGPTGFPGAADGDQVVIAGTATAEATSTLFGGVFVGDVAATNSLFQVAPTGTLTGTGNLTNVDPLLDTNGLQNNGGPTLTIALQAGSPALGAGSNPLSLSVDQRGFGPRTGASGTDIGAYQSDATI